MIGLDESRARDESYDWFGIVQGGYSGKKKTESYQPGGESDDIVKQAINPVAPIGLSDIDERIDVDVRVAGVSENHAAHLALRKRLPDSLDVIRKFRQRHRAILDELHRRRVFEAGENRARGVT